MELAKQLQHHEMVTALRAAGEETRMRLLTVLCHCELTVGELCEVLNQSQPRVSRHLKLLCEGGLLDRHKQGSSAFYRPTRDPRFSVLFSALVGQLDPNDGAVRRDLDRLAKIRATRATSSAEYFEGIAEQWNAVRALHIATDTIEEAILETADGLEISDMLDIGTGTGRMLELFADRIDRGLGIDASQQMLNLARHHLDEKGHTHCAVRHDDAYDLAVEPGSFDFVIVHHVLHYLDDPGLALSQASRALRPGGQLVVVDFAHHDLEHLRKHSAHHWLGFEDIDVHSWFEAAGLVPGSTRHLAEERDDRPLTVSIWTATTVPTAEGAPDESPTLV